MAGSQKKPRGKGEEEIDLQNLVLSLALFSCRPAGVFSRTEKKEFKKIFSVGLFLRFGFVGKTKGNKFKFFPIDNRGQQGGEECLISPSCIGQMAVFFIFRTW